MSIILDNIINENGYYSITDMPSLKMSCTSPIMAKFSYIHGGNAIIFFEGSYIPDTNSRIEIDFKDMLSTLFENAEPQMSVNAFVQPDFVKDIRVEISDNESKVEINFHILNVNAHCTSDIIDILGKRFLTWQPNTKETTLSAPEFLTYFHSSVGEKLTAQFYYAGGLCEIIPLYGWAGITPAVTHNVSPALVLAASACPSEYKLPFYDIFVTDTSGNRISMKQRYILKHATERDKHYLFYNSLGGLDTLIATGSLTDKAEASFDIARTFSGLIPLDISDDYVHSRQNSGYFPTTYIPFLKDFILSKKKKYIVEAGSCKKLVITECDNEFSNKDSLVTFSFGYRKDNDKTEIMDIDVNQELIIENMPSEIHMDNVLMMWDNSIGWENTTMWI